TGMLPGASDDVVIDVPRSDTVTADLRFVTIHSLRCEKMLNIQSTGPSGVFEVETTAVVNNNLTLTDQGFAIGGQLTVNNGLFTWTAGNQSSIAGPGQVQANGGMLISGGGNKTLSGGVTLTNAGTATWTGNGAIALIQGATWNNMSGATLTIQNAQTL